MTEREIKELERKDRIEQVKHNRKLRRMELTAKREKVSNSVLWVWEFSKKMVRICSAIYVVMFIYACVAMWRFFDFTYLGTLISETSEILRACVFGYFIKAGLENVFKILGSKTEQTEPTATEDAGASVSALIPPDGDE